MKGAPEDLRQFWQWQRDIEEGSMLLVYLTLPQLQLPLRTVGEGWAGLQIGSMFILRIWYTMQSVVGKILLFPPSLSYVYNALS